MTTPAPAQRLSRLRRILHPRFLRLFGRHQKGAAAIEFGMVAAPFLAMIFAIIETALIFFAGQTLETAVSDSARLILTGQAQTQGLNQAQFKQAVCAKIYGLFDCSGGINVDVRKYSAFSSATPPSPVDANGNLVNSFVYQPGGPGDIVVARLIYQWPVYANIIGVDMANMAGNKRLLVATAAFRNEPYQ